MTLLLVQLKQIWLNKILGRAVIVGAEKQHVMLIQCKFG